MTRVCMAVVCATLVAAPTVVAQRTFIGTIHYDLVNKGKHIELVATSDGERFRQDVVPRDSIANAYPFTMIVDNLVGDVIWLMPLTHRYSQRHLEAGAPMPEEQRKLEAAGRRERVAGVECDLFLMKTGSTPDEYCIATSLGSVAFVDTVLRRSSLSPGGAAPLERLFAHGGIVLRLRWNSADPAVTMIATSIDRRTPPATLFTVPAGYERIPD